MSQALRNEMQQRVHTWLQQLSIPAEARVVLRIEHSAKNTEIAVPRELVAWLQDALQQLYQEGQSPRTYLTIEQAAALLGDETSNVQQLLAQGELTTIDTVHLPLSGVLQYRQKRQEEQDEALRELTQQAQDLALGY